MGGRLGSSLFHPVNATGILTLAVYVTIVRGLKEMQTSFADRALDDISSIMFRLRLHAPFGSDLECELETRHRTLRFLAIGLHLPICWLLIERAWLAIILPRLALGRYLTRLKVCSTIRRLLDKFDAWNTRIERSEEHTSELQSPLNLVCR